MTRIDLEPVMPEVFSRRRRLLPLVVAVVAAVLVHGLALGSLIWFSSTSGTTKPLAALDLHWISIVAPSERPETVAVAVAPPQVNPALIPQRFNPQPAELGQTDSGDPAPPAVERTVEVAAGPGTVGPVGVAPASEPVKEPLDEPAKEPVKEPARESAKESAKEPVNEPAKAQAHEPTGPLASLSAVHSTEPPPRARVALPEASRRAFDVYLGDFALGQRVAAMDYLFESDGGHYRLRTEGRATGVMAMFYGGLLTQDSRGRVGPEGFMPERYSERRGERPARGVSFDRATGLAEADDGSTQPLQAGVQDQLSAIWQLAWIARMTPAQLTVGHELLWPIARGRRVQSMRIVSLGEETLQPNHSAPLRTLHLTLTSAVVQDDGRLDVWLAADDAMQPIRMKMASAQGLVLDQVLRVPKN